MQDKKKPQTQKANTIGNFEEIVSLAIEKAKTKPISSKNISKKKCLVLK